MSDAFKSLENGLIEPLGFRATGISCGIKENGSKDLGLVLAEVPCETAAVYTRNKIAAAPVVFDAARDGNRISAIVVNSGNANCLTGQTGLDNARETAEAAERHLELPAGCVLVASTGVIGRKLPMDRLLFGVEKICRLIRTETDIRNFSQAIMTTDRKPKQSAVEFEMAGKTVRVGAAAKGAGMIKPDMGPARELHATMLVFVTTDAAVGRDLLEEALAEAVENSFNRISVDNDTSTNDSVFLMASGLAGNPPLHRENADFELFKAALTRVCQDIAKMIVKDGEGATKIFQVAVKNAAAHSDAQRIARAIADSYLVKTAVHGQSPNWGRILAALGYSGGRFELDKLTLSINGLVIFEKGDVNRANESRAGTEMLSPEIVITLDLGVGRRDYSVWSSDLTTDYVKINANYLT